MASRSSLKAPAHVLPFPPGGALAFTKRTVCAMAGVNAAHRQSSARKSMALCMFCLPIPRCVFSTGFHSPALRRTMEDSHYRPAAVFIESRHEYVEMVSVMRLFLDESAEFPRRARVHPNGCQRIAAAFSYSQQPRGKQAYIHRIDLAVVVHVGRAEGRAGRTARSR